MIICDILCEYNLWTNSFSGTLTDLLWADPQDENGRGMSKRGTSMQFGPDVTEQFCKQNGLDYIIRSHEVKEKGWERAHNGKCWTIFSGKWILISHSTIVQWFHWKKITMIYLITKILILAPNYCDQRGNDGAYLTIRPDADLVPVPTEFKAVSHPPCQPMMYANPMLRMAGVI